MRTGVSIKFSIIMVFVTVVTGILIGCNKSSGSSSLSALMLAGGYKQTAKLIDTNTGLAAPAASDYDGTQVSISGDGGTIAMGTLFADKYSCTDNGTILVYRPVDTIWTQIAESSGGETDMYQGTVALSDDGNVFAQGAYKYNSSRGKAFIETWNTDHFEYVEIGGGSADNDRYGSTVAISGNGLVAAVGAVCESAYTGAVYIYVNKTPGGWTLVQTITASDVANPGNFGYSISISRDGGYIVVGAPNINVDTYTHAGAVYIFKKSASAWSWGTGNHETQKITTSIAGTNDQFGHSVAISADASVIAANVYIKNVIVLITLNELGLWEEHWDAVPPEGTTGNIESVALSEDGAVLAAGIPNCAIDLSDQGAVFVLKGKNGIWDWNKASVLVAEDAAAEDMLGMSVSMSADGKTIVAGATGCDIGTNTNQGAAYVFSK